MRLDKYLVAHGLCPTRAKAQDAIQEGRVRIDQVIITKNSYEVQEHQAVAVEAPSLRFVSRAGFKLYDVIKPFGLCLQDRIVIDVGASTGGFSDVCLKEGAKLVYALDVGCEQMDKALLQDPRLHNMEHINCRYLDPSMFEAAADFACIDVSFISLRLILPALLPCMRYKEIVALIKPQFEAGKAYIGKHGIVKDRKVHIRVLKEMQALIQELGLYVHHIVPSSVVGRDGNQEYVFHIKEDVCNTSFDYTNIVKRK